MSNGSKEAASSVGVTHTICSYVIILDEIVFLRFLKIKSDFYQILKSDFQVKRGKFY